MGIPYSRQINSAFSSVQPLVAAGFQTLQTTKNISILLAAIQVLTVVLLGLILAVLLALLVTINPDLEAERRVLITPLVRWGAGFWMPGCEVKWRGMVTVVIACGVLGAGGWVLYAYAYAKGVGRGVAEGEVVEEEREKEELERREGK